MRTAFRDFRVISSTPTLCGDIKGIPALWGGGPATPVEGNGVAIPDDVGISVGRDEATSGLGDGDAALPESGGSTGSNSND